MLRSCLLLAGLALLVSAAPARAGGGDHRHAVPSAGADHRGGHGDRAAIVPAGLAGAPLLTEWWRAPLGTPGDVPANPFVGGGCRTAAHALAMAYPGGHCTLRYGTWIFAVGFTSECSNIEPDPYHADTPLEAALCGFEHDRQMTEVTLAIDDAEPVSLLHGRFGTFMLPGRVRIPESPIFGGTPGQTMRYGGHGYVAFIRPLPVGEHMLHIHFDGPGQPTDGTDFHTAITVTR